ncbi:MAG: hypothetical protein MZV64_02295 [Ignavibacteriales bacterium]|nr:hypothetical protein [Ignavibacteriales bacterium]
MTASLLLISSARSGLRCSPCSTSAAIVWAGVNFARAYMSDAVQFGPPPHVVPDGWCDRPGAWFLPLSFIRLWTCRAASPIYSGARRL